jgi:MYXO-CTERM domain-containing protein
MRLLLASSLLLAPEARADCTLTSIGVVPMSDSTRDYGGFASGLYDSGPGRPGAIETAGLGMIGRIAPLDAAGAPDPGGRIVLISIGMSNTTQEFSRFVTRMASDPSLSPSVTIVDGAQGGQPAESWVDLFSDQWAVVDERLMMAGVTPAQVQVAWVKQANRMPNRLGAFPAHAESLQADLEDIARNLLGRYPNIRIAFFSSRTRAYTDVADSLNPEPFAFESAFAVRWMIERQQSGAADLAFDGATPVAPLLVWGPYLWADGTLPRSDGFVWDCADTVQDFTHPSMTGRDKVAAQLAAFFKTDTLAAPWFLRAAGANPPACAPVASPASGVVPLDVSLTAGSSDDSAVTEVLWTFGDGTFAEGEAVSKTFFVEGTYAAQVTVTDDEGNPVRCSVAIVARPPVPPMDAGMEMDAASPDTGAPDTGGENDTGTVDSGAIDAGAKDSGSPLDSGLTSEDGEGCGCTATSDAGPAALLWLLLGGLTFRRARFHIRRP